MYAVQGRSWVALGDPVGPPDAQRALVSRFRVLARRHGGRPVFYGVSSEQLALYAEQGMGLYKVGEEARVSLDGWTLETPERRRLRTIVRQLERLGCRFEVLVAGAGARRSFPSCAASPMHGSPTSGRARRASRSAGSTSAIWRTSPSRSCGGTGS